MNRLTCTAVVGTLWAGEAALGPAEWVTVRGEEGIFLLETKPGNQIFGLIHDLVRGMAEIGLVRGAIAVIGLCQDKNVVTASEGVLEDGSGTKVDIGVGARGLVGGRAIEVPDAELFDACDLLRHGLLGGGSALPAGLRPGGRTTGKAQRRVVPCLLCRWNTHRGL